MLAEALIFYVHSIVIQYVLDEVKLKMGPTVFVQRDPHEVNLLDECVVYRDSCIIKCPRGDD